MPVFCVEPKQIITNLPKNYTDVVGAPAGGVTNLSAGGSTDSSAGGARDVPAGGGGGDLQGPVGADTDLAGGMAGLAAVEPELMEWDSGIVLTCLWR